MKKLASWILPCLLAFGLAGCGFHLRGTGPNSILAFQSVQVNGNGGVATELRKTLIQQPNVKLVERDAQARIDITSEGTDRQVLSVNMSGQVSEYKIFYRVHFDASNDGSNLLEDATLTLTRNISWDESSILSKDAEIGQLVHEMQMDAAQQIIRRVNAAAKKQATNAP